MLCAQRSMCNAILNGMKNICSEASRTCASEAANNIPRIAAIRLTIQTTRNANYTFTHTQCHAGINKNRLAVECKSGLNEIHSQCMRVRLPRQYAAYESLQCGNEPKHSHTVRDWKRKSHRCVRMWIWLLLLVSAVVLLLLSSPRFTMF